jgi:hypothetical protein
VEVRPSLAVRLGGAIVAIIMAAVVAIEARDSTNQDQARILALRDHGIAAAGTITDVVGRSRSHAPLVVRVQFASSGGRAFANVDISELPSRSANVGDIIRIVYDPADTTNAVPLALLSSNSASTAAGSSVMSGVLVAVGLVLLAWYGLGKISAARLRA